jgi:mRNA-degrading endonuclease YafQ of YafQ-DinJ toxin-antitoxin module
MYEIAYTERFHNDIQQYKKSGEKSILQKIKNLTAGLREHPWQAQEIRNRSNSTKKDIGREE